MNIIPRFGKHLKNGLFNMTKKYTTPSATPPNPPATNPSVTASFNSSKFILKCIVRLIYSYYKLLCSIVVGSFSNLLLNIIFYGGNVQNKHRVLLPKCPKININYKTIRKYIYLDRYHWHKWHLSRV